MKQDDQLAMWKGFTIALFIAFIVTASLSVHFESKLEKKDPAVALSPYNNRSPICYHNKQRVNGYDLYDCTDNKTYLNVIPYTVHQSDIDKCNTTRLTNE